MFWKRKATTGTNGAGNVDDADDFIFTVTNAVSKSDTISKSSLTCYMIIFPGDFVCYPREIKHPRKNVLMPKVTLIPCCFLPPAGAYENIYPIQL